ncbi:MAG: hypothetical protein IKX53_00495 [Bacteroidales bacterium]|nr:hypothetical protein [Bacteroidales bacterium]
MQIKKLTASLRPISIAGVIMGSSLLYSDIDQFSGIRTTLSDRLTSDYVRLNDFHRQEILLSRARFNALYESWRERTLFMSSASDIISDPSFQEIVEMGMAAVPYIIDVIDKDPSTLVWALNKIFGGKISNRQDVTVKEACRLWVKKIKG